MADFSVWPASIPRLTDPSGVPTLRSYLPRTKRNRWDLLYVGPQRQSLKHMDPQRQSPACVSKADLGGFRPTLNTVTKSQGVFPHCSNSETDWRDHPLWSTSQEQTPGFLADYKNESISPGMREAGMILILQWSKFEEESHQVICRRPFSSRMPEGARLVEALGFGGFQHLPGVVHPPTTS